MDRAQVAALLASLALMACGGGGGGGGGDTPAQASYVGNWYQASADLYLEVQTDNAVVLRTCSATGYKTAGTGTIQGDALTLSSTTFNLMRNGDTLTLVDPSAVKVEFTLAGAIPAVCPNNFIEITSVNPSTSAAGVPTSFTVNFDYQLATKDNGIINLGFNISDPDTFTLTPSTLTVIRGTGPGSLTASATPVEYPPPSTFAAFVILSEDPHPVPWVPLSSDTEVIPLVQPAGMSLTFVTNALASKRRGMNLSGWLCGTNLGVSCSTP